VPKGVAFLCRRPKKPPPPFRHRWVRTPTTSSSRARPTTLSRCGDKAARSPYPTNPCPCSAKVFMCNVCTCDCNAHVAPFSPPIRSHISAQGGHQGPVQMITLCGGGNRLISCSLDQTLKIFDINASTCIATLEVLALLALVGGGFVFINRRVDVASLCMRRTRQRCGVYRWISEPGLSSLAAVTYGLFPYYFFNFI